MFPVNMAAVVFRLLFLFLILFNFKHISVHFNVSLSATKQSDIICDRADCAELLSLTPVFVNGSLFTVSPRLLLIRPARSVPF